MKTKYIINKNTIIIDLNYLKELNESYIRNNINIFLVNNNIKFKGDKIIIYKNGLYIGTFYINNKYLKHINKYNCLTSNNSYFEESKIINIKN